METRCPLKQALDDLLEKANRVEAAYRSNPLAGDLLATIPSMKAKIHGLQMMVDEAQQADPDFVSTFGVAMSPLFSRLSQTLDDMATKEEERLRNHTDDAGRVPEEYQLLNSNQKSLECSSRGLKMSHKKSLRKAIARDIKAGLTYGYVLRKYSVSQSLVDKISEELARDKVISDQEFDKFRGIEWKVVDPDPATSPARKAEDSPTPKDLHRSNSTTQKPVDFELAVDAKDKAYGQGKSEQKSGATRPGRQSRLVISKPAIDQTGQVIPQETEKGKPMYQRQQNL